MITPVRKPIRSGSLQLFWDAGLVAALILTLLVVFEIDSLTTPAKNDSDATIVEEVATEPQPTVRKLRLGVTPEVPEYDNMGGLLDSLGEGYKHVNFPLDDLLDDAKIADYDIIFLTCSGYPPTWLNTRIGNSSRGSGYLRNEQTFAKAKEALRKFVRKAARCMPPISTLI